MSGYPKFKGYLVENGIKQEDAAKIIDISLSRFNNKLNGRGDFQMSEVKALCQHYDISSDYYFAENVPKKERKSIS